MLTQHIAIVPEVAGVNSSELARVSAALQKQVIRDLSPIWGISATVDPFPHLEDVPVGYWPIILAFGDLGNDEGIHVDNRGQPYALIEMSPSWSLTASHVCLEMLVDPFGSRTVTGSSPRSDQGGVEFLLEICHPCEDARHGYTVNDVLVSDFCTPEFLTQVPSAKERYSFTGAIQAPYQVLPGGRLTWYDPASNNWWQRNHFGGGARDTDLGLIERRVGRMRGVSNPDAPRHLAATKMSLEAYEERMGIPRQRALRASQSQAHILRIHLGDPGGRGELRLEGRRPPVVDAVRMRSGLPERPQVLAALMRASRGADQDTDFASLLQQAAAAGILHPQSARSPAREAAPRRETAHHSRLDEDDRAYGGRTLDSATEFDEPMVMASTEPAARRPAVQARWVQGARMARSQSSETQPTMRRTTIPPPLPRPTHPPYKAVEVPGGRAVPSSLAPTAFPTVQGQDKPVPSLRDRVLLVAAVAAAGLAAVALFGSVTPLRPTSAAAPDGSLATLPAASQIAVSTASATNPAAEGAAAPRAGVDPATLASAGSASRTNAANLANVAQRAARFRGAAAANAKTSIPSPRATDQSAADSLDLLVEERR